MVMRLIFILTISIFICSIAAAQAPQAEKQLEWFQKGYYILNPAIANAKNEIAFVRRLSGKDSSVGTTDFIFNAKNNYLLNASNRLYDPVVCLYKTDLRQLSLIDYGWAPAFSANDVRLAYAYQATPMKIHDKMYAASFKGNSIKVFSEVKGISEEVAKPFSDFLMDPFFVDSLNLVYKTGSEINGPFGGGISFNEVNLKTKKTNTIRQAAVKYRLFELMGEPYLVNKKLAYTIYTPTDSGTGMAEEYLHLLMIGRDTLQNFGTRRYSNLNYKFAYNDKNELLFLDDGHLLTEDTNYLNIYRNNVLIERKPLNDKYVKGYLSPDGRYIFYVTGQQEAYLLNVKNFEQTKLQLPAKEFHAIVWSANSRKLVIVQDHENDIGTDMLYLFTVH